MHNRVVITGLGVVSPNGIGVPAFADATKKGLSGIRYDPQLAALKFSCQISGKPEISEALQEQYFSELELKQLNSSGIIYGVMAGIEAWTDAGFPLLSEGEVDWESGTIFGTGIGGVEKFRDAVYKIDALQVRRLGCTVVTQIMASSISAFLGGKLGLGNQVTTNSSACTTGTESVLMAYERIKQGYAKRMLAGSTSDSGPYIWGGFDAMRVCTCKHNENAAAGSRPMSASASGIVPGSGAGALVLESLNSALERNVPIYAEILGGNINCGGQRNGGSMTAPNNAAVQRCIQDALCAAGVSGAAINLINGHLTATGKDAEEVKNWCAALNRRGADFPYLNSLKSMIGHGLSAAGSMELVMMALQLKEGFVFPNINCEDIHPEILSLIETKSISQALLYKKELNLAVKASFGFGDVNACIILKKYL